MSQINVLLYLEKGPITALNKPIKHRLMSVRRVIDIILK